MSTVIDQLPDMDKWLEKLDKMKPVSNLEKLTFSDLFESSKVKIKKKERELDITSLELRSLKDKNVDDWTKIRDLNQEKENVKKSLISVSQSLEDINAKILFNKSKCSEFEKTISSRGRELQQLKSSAVHVDNGLQSKMKELERYCQLCESVLGFDVKVVSKDTFIFKFMHMDPEDNGKEFLCKLHVPHKDGKDKKLYKVLECYPEIGNVKEKLEEILNKTEDLSGFFVVLRKVFAQNCGQK